MADTTKATGSSPQAKKSDANKTNQYILYAILAVLVIGVGFLMFRGISNKNTPTNGGDNNQEQPADTVETGTISGTIVYNGLKPQEGDQGYVKLMYREHGTTEFKELENFTIPLEDNATFSVPDVPVNKTYDAKAVLYAGGQKITDSNVITVSAPSSDNVLEFNVTFDMLPDSALEQNPVKMSGHVDINGYIPTGSVLKVYAKEVNKPDTAYQMIAEEPITGARTYWTWDNALAGREYNLYVEAYTSQGNLFAKSNVGTKAAPAKNVYFVITSRASAPEQKATISGRVKVNGSFDSGTQVKIKTREHNTGEYQTVTTVSPSNSYVSWTWTGATSGKTYDVKAYLSAPDGKDLAEGTHLTVVAPAQNVDLVVDLGSGLSKPEDKPSLSRCYDNPGGDTKKYTAILTFKNVDDAKKYKLQVGKNPGEANVANSVVNNSGDTDPTLTINVNKDDTYYARYAYTDCSDCTDDSSFSPFSDTLEFDHGDCPSTK